MILNTDNKKAYVKF